MQSEPKIAVIGSNMVDLVTSVVRMPKLGETLEAPDFDLGFGGKGANQAVAAARLGANVVMVSKVGDDLFGGRTIENMQNNSIDTKYVEIVKNTASGVAPIFVDEQARNCILIVKGANKFLSCEDIEKARDDLLDCDLIILQLEVPLETVYCAIEFGYKNNITVLLNPAPGAPLDYKYVSKVDVLMPNESELEIISGMPVDSVENIKKAAMSLLAKGVKSVVVTLGSKGALLVEKDRMELIEAEDLVSKDTTGAGDAFIGSFAYHYVKSQDIFEAMKVANIYAGLSTLNVGTQKSFYNRLDFEKYLKTKKHLI